MSRQNFPRAFVAVSAALVLLTAVAPVALAAGHGKSGDHGKPASSGNSGDHGNESDTTAIAKATTHILKAISTSPLSNGKGKKFDNDGNALTAQSRALAKKLTRFGSANPAVASVLATFLSSVDSATATIKTAFNAARTTYLGALAAATTDAAKQSAKDVYVAAIAAAHQAFSATMQSAALALKTALGTLQTSIPAPSTSPSPSPSPSPSSP